MRRLFVAIRPPGPIRALLLAAMGGISGARWQSDEQLHLTLRFIGEVDRHLAGDIAAALSAVRQAPFEIALSGLGWFEVRDKPDAIWAGLKPQEPLKALHGKIDRALGRVGIAPDARAYVPHVTLARLKRGAGPIGGLLEHAGGLASPPFTVSEFHLYESDLTPDGSVYSLIERYRIS